MLSAAGIKSQAQDFVRTIVSASHFREPGKPVVSAFKRRDVPPLMPRAVARAHPVRAYNFACMFRVTTPPVDACHSICERDVNILGFRERRSHGPIQGLLLPWIVAGDVSNPRIDVGLQPGSCGPTGVDLTRKHSVLNLPVDGRRGQASLLPDSGNS